MDVGVAIVVEDPGYDNVGQGGFCWWWQGDMTDRRRFLVVFVRGSIIRRSMVGIVHPHVGNVKAAIATTAVAVVVHGAVLLHLVAVV